MGLTMTDLLTCHVREITITSRGVSPRLFRHFMHYGATLYSAIKPHCETVTDIPFAVQYRLNIQRTRITREIV